MARIFDLHGLVSLAINDEREHIFRQLDAQLDPYEPRIALVPPHADIVLSPNPAILSRSLSDVHGPAGDGRRTGSDGRRCYLLRGISRFELPRVYPQDGQVSLSYDPNFPLWDALSELVRPLLQLGTLEHGAITVHGATVEVEGGGLLVCGWSESGKTETALALAEQGARFISDKWTILDSDGLAARLSGLRRHPRLGARVSASSACSPPSLPTRPTPRRSYGTSPASSAHATADPDRLRARVTAGPCLHTREPALAPPDRAGSDLWVGA